MLTRLALFPDTTRFTNSPAGSSLSIANCDLAELAERYGTPLYLYDRATLDSSLSAYRQALAAAYNGPAGVTYAGKAYLCVALAQWADAHQLWLDCTGAGELAVAEAASVRRERVLVHGVNKSPADLGMALRLAGTIVVDNLTELERLADAWPTVDRSAAGLWLRFRPGVEVSTHAHIRTGQEDSKFGMSAAEIMQAVQSAGRWGLPLAGLHFHLGSHLHDPTPLGPALERALDLLAAITDSTGWTLCVGGGWGVAYHEDDLPQPRIADYVEFVAGTIGTICRARRQPLPHLQLEPGRSLVARAGVALYRVGAVKRTPGRRWLLLDGGLADNPRPALYGARYSALPVSRPDRPTTGPAWLGGPYCESGDVLIEALPLPDIQPGELIAVPVSGAYHLSMASNYNGACRPAVLWLDQGTAQLIQTRETPADLLHRDRPLIHD